MPRYFFHLRDGVDVLLDEEGRELADQEAIDAATLFEVRSMISSDALDGQIRLDQRLDIEDAEGRIVHSLAFKDAVEIMPPDA
jgi:hypothetical protein